MWIVETTAGSGVQLVGLLAAQVIVLRGQYIISGADIITAVDCLPVETRNDLLLVFEEHDRPSNTVNLTIVCGGQRINQAAVLDAE